MPSPCQAPPTLRPASPREHEVDRAFDRRRRAGCERRDHVAVGLPGGGHERLACVQADGAGPRVSIGRAAHRRPEMAARSGLTESERGQVPPGGRFAKERLRLVRRGRVTGHAAQVHQVDHRRRRAALRHRVENRGHRAQTLAEAAICCRHGQAEQSALAERRDRLAGERRVLIDTRRLRPDLRVGDGGRVRHDPVLFVVQSVHVTVSCHEVRVRSIVSAAATRSVHTSGSRSSMCSNNARVAGASPDATKTFTWMRAILGCPCSPTTSR